MKLYSYIKIAYRKLFRISANEADKFQLLKENMNIKIGANCKIENLNIHTYKTKKGYLNIEIGDDCYLMGNITLHSENSRIKIGNRVFIGPDTTFFCYDSIEIHDDVMFSWGCTVIDTNAHSLKSEESML